ncbi:MAG TPA: DUF1592 domain-containing protein [Polyangiales bacterium]|nr:DUF1592 domain-containing protein [Polyangiales bacterium]
MQHPQEARAVNVSCEPTRDGAQTWKIGWLAACLLSACTGTIEPSNRPGLSDIGAAGAAAGAAGTGFNNLPIAGNGVVGINPSGTGCQEGVPPATTRMARLTHKQYDNTIHALTGLDLHLAADFLADPHQAGFDRGLDLQVGDVLARAYRDAAESVADSVLMAPTAYAKVLGCAATQGDTCAQSFIGSFGKSAFRRPLTAAEQSSYLALFKQGPDLVDTGDDFQRGVRVVLEAFLQSPKFLYRIEMSQTPAASAIALSSYEVASRLSYMLVSSPPDATLMQAADADQLRDPNAVASQAARLLTIGDAAHETVRDFHHQWLELDVYPQKLTKDPTRFPMVTPALAGVMQSEVEKFVDAVSFTEHRGFQSLMTAPFTYVNRTTAALYGVTGQFTDGLQRVSLDPAQRAGLLTQVGFLATHAFSAVSSPIHRGVFVQRRLLCNAIPPPPPNVPALPAVDGAQIRTTRQQVDQHTSPQACAGCHHTLINPVGFGLENFDAVGAFRTQENNVPIDATGMLAGTRANAAFSDGVGLAKAVAEAPEARACYAKNWFRYTLGRAETPADACTIAELADKLQSDEYTALNLLTDLTRTSTFLYRSAENP